MALMAQREFNVDKNASFSEWYNTVIYAADLVDVRYNVQGFVVHKPWSTRVLRKLYSLFEAELEKDGHEPVSFPVVIPKENIDKEASHLEGFAPELFWVTKGGNNDLARPLALRPTSETAFYQMYSLWVQGVGDLPLKYYQSCSVYRYEHETLPFLRGREFMFIETHTAFAEKAEAAAQVAKDMVIARRVLEGELGLAVMQFVRPHWDTFPGAENTYANDVVMPDGKANQIASTHMLGQHFSKPFNVSFEDASGEKKYVYDTCFGPGIWRVMAALIAVHGDNKGLIFSPVVAPVQVVIIPIFKAETRDAVLSYAVKARLALEKKGWRVALDDSDKSPGFKYNEWELKGVPLRLEIGGREAEAGNVTLVRRDTHEKALVPFAVLPRAVARAGKAVAKELAKRSKAGLKTRITKCKSVDAIGRVLDGKGGFCKVNLCSVGADGTECGKLIQEKTAGKVRGTLYGADEKASGKCVACGKPARTVVYVARQY